MKILFVSFYFPPFNTVAARRTGKLVYHLEKLGHDVRVLTASKQGSADGMEVQISSEKIFYSHWVNHNSFVERIMGGKKRIDSHGYPMSAKSNKIVNFLSKVYKTLFHIPDAQIGWYFFGVKKGETIISSWKPDIIYSSANPYTSLLIGRKLGKKFSIPFVAEFRDLWLDNPYLDLPWLRKPIDGFLEKLVLRDACGFVTVSEPLKEQLRVKTGSKEIEVVRNGVDLEEQVLRSSASKNKVLKIVYTGMIYDGKRDPSVLFEAISLLNEKKICIRLEFYGRYTKSLSSLVSKYNLQKNVTLRGMVTSAECAKIQTNTDINLLLLWDDDREDGSFTGKFFEYIGAGKTILVLGRKNNVASKVVIEEGIGLVSHDVMEIKAFLENMYLTKLAGKPLFEIRHSIKKKYSRERSAKQLSNFLERKKLSSGSR